MFFKKALVFNDTFVWNGVQYQLTMDQEMFATQYDLMIRSFLRLLDNEIPIAQTNHNVVPETSVPVQLSRLVLRSMGNSDIRVQFQEWFRNKVDQFHTRLIECIQRIHVDVDPLYLHVIKGRFFRCMVEELVTSTDENWEIDWVAADKEIPWLWLIPHYQTAFQIHKGWQSIVSGAYSRPAQPGMSS